MLGHTNQFVSVNSRVRMELRKDFRGLCCRHFLNVSPPASSLFSWFVYPFPSTSVTITPLTYDRPYHRLNRSASFDFGSDPTFEVVRWRKVGVQQRP